VTVQPHQNPAAAHLGLGRLRASGRASWHVRTFDEARSAGCALRGGASMEV